MVVAYCVVAADGRPVRWGTCAPSDYDLQPTTGQQVIPDHPPSEKHRLVNGEWILESEE